MICKHCNQQNEPGSRFCASCGNPLDVSEESAPIALSKPAQPQNTPSFGQGYVPPQDTTSYGQGYELPQGTQVTAPPKSSLEQVLKIVMFICIVPYVINFLSNLFGVFTSLLMFFDGYFILSGVSLIFSVLGAASSLLLGGTLFLAARSKSYGKSDLLFHGVLVVSALRVAVCVLMMVMYSIAAHVTNDVYARRNISSLPDMNVVAIIFAIGVTVVAYNCFIKLHEDESEYDFSSKEDFIALTTAAFELYKGEFQTIVFTKKKTGNKEAGPELLKTNRSVAAVIFLSIITLGIYLLYVLYDVAESTKKICDGDGENTGGFLAILLLPLVTCGIYGIVWEYKVCNRLAANAPRYNVTITENGTTFLLWKLIGAWVCGIGILVAYHIMFKNLNKLSAEYNKKLQMEYAQAQHNA